MQANTFGDLPGPFFVLAPMDDVTDTVFRQVVAGCAAPDLFFTEFVNVDGLMSPGRPNLLKKLRFAETEGKVVAQLWGLQPENFRAVCEQIASGELARELGLPPGVNFAGVDLNMGCPAKSEVKNGACAALIKLENRELARQIIEASRAGLRQGPSLTQLPLSVKTRVGFSEVDMTWFDFLLRQELDMLTVHGRTRKQMSKVPADWELIGQVREMRDKLGVKTLIVGNGDVQSRAHGEELARRYKLDGIMVGRGIFTDPYLFALHQDGPREWEKCDEISKIELFRKHIELFAETWQQGERPIVTLNKFCKMYIQGFDGASALRAALMTSPDYVALLYLLDNHVKAVASRPTSEVPTEVAPATDVPYDDEMNTTIKAIVFDSDGTLLDTRKMIFEGYKEVLKRHGLEHLATDQYIRQRLGKPTTETFEQLIAGHATHLDPKDLAHELDEVQGGSMLHYIKQYPHTKEILEEWKGRGVKLCLFTSGYGYMIPRNFAAAGIDNVEELFDAIITADEDLPRKPEPNAILELLKRVGVEPSNAVVIGDHAYDMIAASRASVGLKVGMLHGVGTQHELLTAGADFLSNNLSSLNHLMNFATK